MPPSWRTLAVQAPVPDHPTALCLRGAALLSAAAAAARRGDRREATAALNAATVQGERLNEDRAELGTAFGPSNVGIHRVAIAIEIGDAKEALKESSSVTLSEIPAYLGERRARYLIDVARTHAQAGDGTARHRRAHRRRAHRPGRGAHPPAHARPPPDVAAARAALLRTARAGRALPGAALRDMPTTTPDAASDPLRLLHWNIHSWRDGAGEPNMNTVAELIEETKPHLVSLVEVDEEWKETNTLDALAERCGYASVFTPAFEYGDDSPRGGFGNALLTTLPILTVRQRQLVWPVPAYDHTEPSEPRSVILARVDFHGVGGVGRKHAPATSGPRRQDSSAPATESHRRRAGRAVDRVRGLQRAGCRVDRGRRPPGRLA
jgi:hypothetical protein